jgi:hypothetical protein
MVLSTQLVWYPMVLPAADCSAILAWEQDEDGSSVPRSARTEFG